jgi:hypothetical protein
VLLALTTVKDRERIEGKVKKIILIGSGVLAALIMKCYIFWNITPCIPLNINRRFRGTYRFYLQGRKISQASCYLLHASYLLGPLFDPEDGDKIFIQNVGLHSTDYMAFCSLLLAVWLATAQ